MESLYAFVEHLGVLVKPCGAFLCGTSWGLSGNFLGIVLELPWTFVEPPGVATSWGICGTLWSFCVTSECFCGTVLCLCGTSWRPLWHLLLSVFVELSGVVVEPPSGLLGEPPGAFVKISDACMGPPGDLCRTSSVSFWKLLGDCETSWGALVESTSTH